MTVGFFLYIDYAALEAQQHNYEPDDHQFEDPEELQLCPDILASTICLCCSIHAHKHICIMEK